MNAYEQARIYADACRAWYGDKARDVILGKLEEERRTGNLSGLRLWQLTANELARQQGRNPVYLS
jgi:hypothetical protein